MRYKARLVVLGNTQEEGEDFYKTFSPITKMTTIHCVLSLAAPKGWELYQMGVYNAFLHGDLQEKIYVRLPLGF